MLAGVMDSGHCCGVAELMLDHTIKSVKDVEGTIKDAKNQNFGYILASAVVRTYKNKKREQGHDSQLKEANLLKKAGFKRLGVFTNPRTGNKIELLGYKIPGVKVQEQFLDDGPRIGFYDDDPFW